MEKQRIHAELKAIEEVIELAVEETPMVFAKGSLDLQRLFIVGVNMSTAIDRITWLRKELEKELNIG